MHRRDRLRNLLLLRGLLLRCTRRHLQRPHLLGERLRLLHLLLLLLLPLSRRQRRGLLLVVLLSCGVLSAALLLQPKGHCGRRGQRRAQRLPAAR